MRLRLASILAVVTLLGCGNPAEPTGLVRRGLYVLASIDQQPPPLIIYRQDFGDTLSALGAFDYDSIRIVNDTLVERHFSRSDYQQRPGQAPVVLATTSVSAAGLILPRDSEIVLLLQTPFGPAQPAESFAVRPEGLLRRVLISRARCVAVSSCIVISHRYADALYTRR